MQKKRSSRKRRPLLPTSLVSRKLSIVVERGARGSPSPFGAPPASPLLSSSLSSALLRRRFRVKLGMYSHPAFPYPSLTLYRSMSGFTIIDSQSILLKFLDGYLDLPSNAASLPALALSPFLLSALSTLAQDLLTKTKMRDTRDALTFQSIVLLLLGLTSIGLASDAGRQSIIPCVETVVGMSFFLPLHLAALN